MTLANMRELGVIRLIASCLNDACRHSALIEVWTYPAGNRSCVLQAPGGVREVWRAGERHRRAAELERVATDSDAR